MPSRSLLHKDKLEEFLAWCRAEKSAETRPGVGEWQVAQIRFPDSKIWHGIYTKVRAPEHLSVPDPLIREVKSFIDSTRSK